MFMALFAPREYRPRLALTFAALLVIGVGVAVATGLTG